MATTVDITSIPHTRSKFDEKNQLLVVMAMSLLGLVLCVSALLFLHVAPGVGAVETVQMVVPGL